VLIALNWVGSMCETCVAIDREIENLRREQRAVDDPFALTLIAMTIDKLESEKAALHPVSDNE
jgi:hypothetical protein